MKEDTVVTWKSLSSDLAQRIAAGEFSPGERLPSGDALAQQLGVNRNTVHRAIEELQRLGLVIRRKGSGTVVTGRPATPHVTIALLVDGYSAEHNFPSGDIMRGIQDRIGDDNSLIVADSKHDAELEDRQLTRLRREVDGVLVYPARPEAPSPMLVEMIEEGYPIVVLDRALHGIDADTVMTDNLGATRLAVNTLIERGHRRIAFISFDKLGFSSVGARFEGYRQAMAEAGIEDQPDLIRWLPIGSDDNMSVFHQVVHDTLFTLRNIEDPATAIFCVEEQIACAIVPVCERLGIDLTQDLELATFHDWHPMTLRTPWNVHRLIQRKLDIGQVATSLLLDRLASPGRVPQTRLIDADLVLADAGLEESFASPLRQSRL